MKHIDELTDNEMLDLVEPKSKTKLKKEMIAKQKLGEQLVDLPISYLKKSGIPEKLLDAVLTMKNMRTHGARRRQMQHIGVLMRDADPVHIEKVLNSFGQQKPTSEPIKTKQDELAQFLIQGRDEHIEDILKQHPLAERSRLRILVRNAKGASTQKEQERAHRALRLYLTDVTK